MIETSPAWSAAIVGDFRRMYIKAVVDISDPDMAYTGTQSNSLSPYSVLPQVLDKELEPFTRYATLERNRWLLGGGFDIYPLPEQITGQSPYLSRSLSGPNCVFPAPVWVAVSMRGVSILQGVSVYFSDDPQDGVPDTFTVEILQGGTAYFSQDFEGNRETEVLLEGFTVYDPDQVRVTVRKWSLPNRRVRIREIIPGFYEKWDAGEIATLDINQQVNISCLALPYGTCSLTINNANRRFEPRNKNGVFLSIQERQGVAVSLGVRQADGTVGYVPAGIYYQYSGGWKTGENGLTMKWELVDMVGLLAGRQYFPPAALPTTLGGWIASLAAQLGENFAGRYTVDPAYAGKALTVNSYEDVEGVSCGDLLRFACMATETFPRADAETGYLTVEPLWSQGNQMTLENLNDYPVMRANGDLAALIFTIYAGEDKESYVVSGTSESASDTVAVDNPFIHSTAQALEVARFVLSAYGGNQIETTGRGNPSSELGDVDTVWLDESGATTGRRIRQALKFSNGVLRSCQSVLLQADGAFRYDGVAVITQSGTWRAPAEAGNSLRAFLVGGGSGSSPGTAGTWEAAGEQGAPGAGAKVWHGNISINKEQVFQVTIGEGGAPGQDGMDTTFGAYSSGNGRRYTPSYTDILSGNAYGRSGVPDPRPNSGDGAQGGAGGVQGARRTVATTGVTINGNTGEIIATWPATKTEVLNEPGPGEPGKRGGSGCVVVYWSKEATA